MMHKDCLAPFRTTLAPPHFERELKSAVDPTPEGAASNLVPASAARSRKMRRVQTDSHQMAE